MPATTWTPVRSEISRRPGEVAADAPAGGLDDGPPAQGREAGELLDGDVDVVEGEVVAVAERVLAQVPQQRLADRGGGELVGVEPGRGAAGPPRRDVVEQVLVAQDDPEVVEGDGTADGLDASGPDGHRLAPGWPEMRPNSRALSRMATMRISPWVIGTQ